jgi:hypothetical protein
MDDIKDQTQIARLAGVESSQSFGVATASLTYTFGSVWFADAMNEARDTDYNARRREILFAVCAAESYLFEWVRDDVLKSRFREVTEYFPANRRRGVTGKWRELPKQLAVNGKIASAPNLGLQSWTDFVDLVKYRDGLIHARASRPLTVDTQQEELPFPTNDDLVKLSPGWPTRVVAQLIRELNLAAGLSVPQWVTDP